MSERKVVPLFTRENSMVFLSASSRGSPTQASGGLYDPKLRRLADKLEGVGEDTDGYGISQALENFRMKLKRFFFTSYLGRLFNVVMLVLSVLSVVEYIYTTYLSPSKKTDLDQLDALKVIELVVAILFTFDWALSFFLADHKMIFLTSFYSMVDLMTVIPIYATYNASCSDFISDIYDYSAYQIINYGLCALTTTRILRALRVHRLIDQYLEDEVEQYLGHMALNVAIMIFFNASLMQFIEADQDLSFHTWMYYMTVTITSVGYGDITPNHDLGRFAAMAMISFAIITVPQMTNILIEKMSRQSIYARLRYIPKTSASAHVLVCGNLQSISWGEFLEELFHEDHHMKGILHCVVLQPKIPSPEMKGFLKDPRFQLTLTYLEGSPLNNNDLKRADAANARAIFLLTNKFAANPDEEDAKIIMEQFSIQKFIRLHSIGYETPLFCLQLIRPENKRHLVTSARDMSTMFAMTSSSLHLGDDNNHESNPSNNMILGGDSEVVVCLNEIKMGVIAKAIMFPGANTLIVNLLTSFSDEETNAALLQSNSIKPMEGIETLEEDERGNDWMGEYQRGCDWEIYTSELSPTFEGTSFCALADILYQKLGVVLFGIEIEEVSKAHYSSESYPGGGSSSGSRSKKDRNNRRVYLNPADFIIPSQEEYHLLAFVIAKNKAQSDLTFSKLDAQDSIFASRVDLSNFSALARAMGSMAGQLGGAHSTDYLRASTNTSPNRSRTNSNDRPDNSMFSGYGRRNGTGSSGHPKLQRKTTERKLDWRDLLRRYEPDKRTETIQEELQRIENQLLHENYFTRENNSVELSDIYIHTSFPEEFPFVDNHIIIFGKSLSNLHDLIRPLRAKALGILKHIVILYPGEFPLNVWQRISVFEAVWIVRGSGLEEADLRRCGVFKAKQVILLASSYASTAMSLKGDHPTNSSNDNTDEFEGISAMDDVDTVFCYQAIKRMNESCHIVVEIIHHTNVGYLDPESGLNSSVVDYKFTPQFSGGSLFASSILDTLVCQAFYNTKIIDILSKLIGSDRDHAFLALNEKQLAAAEAKGLIGSSLYQIPLPEKLETRTYGALFHLLVKKKRQIPLGILRGVFSNTKSGPKGNSIPYVFTNPPKDTELFSCDKIFVLSQTPVKITRSTTKEENKEFHFYSTIRNRRKTAEDVLNMVNIVKEEISVQQQRNGQLESQMQELMEDFHQQMVRMTKNIQDITQSVLFEPQNQPTGTPTSIPMLRPSSAGGRRVTGLTPPSVSFDEVGDTRSVGFRPRSTTIDTIMTSPGLSNASPSPGHRKRMISGASSTQRKARSPSFTSEKKSPNASPLLRVGRKRFSGNDSTSSKK